MVDRDLGEKVFSQAYIQLTQTMNDLWRDYKLSLPWVPLNINKATSDPPKPAPELHLYL